MNNEAKRHTHTERQDMQERNDEEHTEDEHVKERVTRPGGREGGGMAAADTRAAPPC